MEDLRTSAHHSCNVEGQCHGLGGCVPQSVLQGPPDVASSLGSGILNKKLYRGAQKSGLLTQSDCMLISKIHACKNITG